METKILNGLALRDKKALELGEKTAALSKHPVLAILQAGNRPESDVYIRQKIKFGEKAGFEVRRIDFDDSVQEDALLGEIQRLNNDAEVDGIIVQLPLPDPINAFNMIEAINPDKDVDCLTSFNLKKLVSGDMTGFMPATTKGIISLLEHYEIETEGKKAVIVGRSNLVGKPTAFALLNLNATVTVCHSRTRNLAEETKQADILIVATGKRALIGRDHVCEGQTVIDVGINPEEEDGQRRLYGDVDAEAVRGIAGAMTPVPGGVGPLTVASLFENVLKAAGRKNRADAAF